MPILDCCEGKRLAELSAEHRCLVHADIQKRCVIFPVAGAARRSEVKCAPR